MIRFLRQYCCGLVLLSVFVCAPSVCSSQEPIDKATLSAPATKETQEHEAILKFINLPTSALPKDVRLVARIRTAPLIPATRNPDVLVDPQQLMPVARFFGVSDESDMTPIRLGVVAIYQEKESANEIGVYGLYFADEGAAKKRFEKLTGEKEDSPFILKGKLLLYVWKDDSVSKSAFEAVRDNLRKAKFKPADRS